MMVRLPSPRGDNSCPPQWGHWGGGTTGCTIVWVRSCSRSACRSRRLLSACCRSASGSRARSRLSSRSMGSTFSLFLPISRRSSFSTCTWSARSCPRASACCSCSFWMSWACSSRTCCCRWMSCSWVTMTCRCCSAICRSARASSRQGQMCSGAALSGIGSVRSHLFALVHCCVRPGLPARRQLDLPHVQTVQQHTELHGAQLDLGGLLSHLRPAEATLLQSLIVQDEAPAVPDKDLDPVGPAPAEDEERAAVEVCALGADQGAQAVDALAQVHRLGRQVDADRGRQRQQGRAPSPCRTCTT